MSKTLTNTELGKLPFFDLNPNHACAKIAALAMNMCSWMQLAALPAPTTYGPRVRCDAVATYALRHRS